MFMAFMSSGCVQRNPFWIYPVGSTKNRKTDIGDVTLLVAVVLFCFVSLRDRVGLGGTRLKFRLSVRPTCTIYNILHVHGWLRGQKSEQQNDVPSPKINAAAGCKAPV